MSSDTGSSSRGSQLCILAGVVDQVNLAEQAGGVHEVVWTRDPAATDRLFRDVVAHTVSDPGGDAFNVDLYTASANEDGVGVVAEPMGASCDSGTRRARVGALDTEGLRTWSELVESRSGVGGLTCSRRPLVVRRAVSIPCAESSSATSRVVRRQPVCRCRRRRHSREDGHRGLLPPVRVGPRAVGHVPLGGGRRRSARSLVAPDPSGGADASPADSGPTRSPNPAQADHRFRFNPITNSGRTRSPIPVSSRSLFRGGRNRSGRLV